MERSVEIGDDFGCNFSSLNVKYASYITSKRNAFYGTPVEVFTNIHQHKQGKLTKKKEHLKNQK